MIVVAATAVNFVLFVIAIYSKSYYPYFFLFLFSYCVFFLCGFSKDKGWYPYRDGKNPYWPVGLNSVVAAVAGAALLASFDLSRPFEIVLDAIALVVTLAYLFVALKRKWIASFFSTLFTTNKP